RGPFPRNGPRASDRGWRTAAAASWSGRGSMTSQRIGRSLVERILEKLEGVTDTTSGWSARCPAHVDTRASLTIASGADWRVLLHCHAGCTPEVVVAALGLTMTDLFSDRGEGARVHPAGDSTIRRGLTLAEYAAAKGLPENFLRGLGVAELVLERVRVLRIPYYDAEGAVIASRLRFALDGDRFRWTRGCKPQL